MQDTMKIAEDLWKRMSIMKLDEGHSYAHHPQEFLPADVCCDFAGQRRFINILKEVLDKHLNPKLSCNDCSHIVEGYCETYKINFGDATTPCNFFELKNKNAVRVACWACWAYDRKVSECTRGFGECGQNTYVLDPLLLHSCISFEQKKG